MSTGAGNYVSADTHQGPQRGLRRERDSEPAQHPGAGTSGQLPDDDAHLRGQPHGPSLIPLDDASRLLTESLPWTVKAGAAHAPRPQADQHAPPADWQVGDLPMDVAMHPASPSRASRACHRIGPS